MSFPSAEVSGDDVLKSPEDTGMAEHHGPAPSERADAGRRSSGPVRRSLLQLFDPLWSEEEPGSLAEDGLRAPGRVVMTLNVVGVEGPSPAKVDRATQTDLDQQQGPTTWHDSSYHHWQTPWYFPTSSASNQSQTWNPWNVPAGSWWWIPHSGSQPWSQQQQHYYYSNNNTTAATSWSGPR